MRLGRHSSKYRQLCIILHVSALQVNALAGQFRLIKPGHFVFHNSRKKSCLTELLAKGGEGGDMHIISENLKTVDCSFKKG